MSRIVESLFAKYDLNEDFDKQGLDGDKPDWGFIKGKEYKLDNMVFKYEGSFEDNGFNVYKFTPINDEAKEFAQEQADDEYEYDGFAYFDDDGIYYSFIEPEDFEDEETEEIIEEGCDKKELKEATGIRENTNKLLDLVDYDIIDASDLVVKLLNYMSEDEVTSFMESEGLDEYENNLDL